ncbi:MAG: DUF3999 family protein [Vicinamibacterales bacterium]
MRARTTLVLVVCVAAGLAAQVPETVDAQRSAWRYRRAVGRPEATGDGLWSVVVPPDLRAHAQPGLGDLRLIDAAGREAAFVLQEDAARTTEARWTGTLAAATTDRRRTSVWTVDFGRLVRFDRLALDIPGVDFAKRLIVELSDDGQEWREVAGEWSVFDRAWDSGRVHETSLDIGPVEARYARLTFDDRRSAPVDVEGADAVLSGRIEGTSWSEETALEPVDRTDGRSRYRVPVPDGYPVRRIEVDADDPAFARTVRVLDGTGSDAPVAGEGLVYRARLPDESLLVDARQIAIDRRGTGALVIEVADSDSPPLINARVRLSGPRTLAVVSTTADHLTLYYGNPVTRPPLYDLDRLRTTLALVPEFPVAVPDAETENPRFAPPAPLAFVAARGAGLDAAGWRFERPVEIEGNEDLYTLTLPAADTGHLRADAGDLRLVDDQDRQVPYVLEPGAARVELPLTIASAEPRQGRPRVSAFRLAVPEQGAEARPLEIQSLRLRFAEAYFQRTGDLLVPRSGAPLGMDTLASVSIAVPRGGGSGGAPTWVELPVPGVASPVLGLEIQDGDNQPLTMLQASAVVRVPRITFKATPGAYRLLLGNPDAARPSYELDGLRREVLAYSAVPLTVDGEVLAGPNPAYTTGVGDLLRLAPPRAVLWIALGVAVAVLLALTARILRRETPSSQ